MQALHRAHSCVVSHDCWQFQPARLWPDACLWSFVAIAQCHSFHCRCCHLSLLPAAVLPQLTKNFTSVCVTDTGALGGVLLGVVATRDVDFINDRATPLEEVMTR